MSAVLLAALDFLAAAGITVAVICVRRANRKVRRILDGRRWQQTTHVDPDDVLDLIAEAEGITLRAAAGESWEA